MIWHPLILAVLVSDLTAALLLVMSAAAAFQVLLHWQPESSGRRQLRLETRADATYITGRWAAAVFVFSTLLCLAGICSILPEVVPGAMCGTGVVQASQGYGATAVLLRFLALGFLLLWVELEKINRAHPEAPLAVSTARAVLVAFPLFCLALWVTWQFALQLDTAQPVDCCTVVYDQFAARPQASDTVGIPDRYWVGAFVGLTLMLGLMGGCLAFNRSRARQSRFRLFLAVTVLVWGPIAVTATVRVLSAYHFGILHHHCPWCLFLPEHRAVGFFLLAAFSVALFEGLVTAVVPAVVGTQPALAETVQHRLAGSGRRILAAMAVILLLTTGPAILWRLRHGVWMGG